MESVCGGCTAQLLFNDRKETRLYVNLKEEALYQLDRSCEKKKRKEEEVKEEEEDEEEEEEEL